MFDGFGALGEFALGETGTEGIIIAPTSISSAEAFGVPSVLSDGYGIIGAGGIVSAEALGNPTVWIGNLISDAGGIASAEAFGAPSVVLVIAPGSINSVEAFGVPAVYKFATYLPVSRVMSGGVTNTRSKRVATLILSVLCLLFR